MKKYLIRKLVKKRKKKYNLKKLSEKIFSKILASGILEDAEKIFTYVSKPDEVDTLKLIKYLLENGRDVYVPRINGRDIQAVRLKNIRQLKPGKFNILEPEGKASNTRNFDLIFVPGVAFDFKGNRVGRGMGYFDRFFEKARGKKIGLAFHFQVFKKIPADTHDIKVDEVITDL